MNVGQERRENSLGLGWEAMLPRTPRTATTLRCTWREAQARTRKSGVVGEVGRLSHGSGRGVRMPPPSEHSGGGGGVGWGVGLGEWVGVSIVTSEFVRRPEKKKKKTGTKSTHTFSMVVFSLKAVDFSVASKRKDYLFFKPPAFFLLLHPNVPFPTSHVVFPTSSFFLNWSVFFFFQPWRFFQPHGKGNGSVFAAL